MATEVTYDIVRQFDENEYEREGRNGRLYRGRVGWRWLLIKTDRFGPVVIDDTRTKREATEKLARIRAAKTEDDSRPESVLTRADLPPGNGSSNAKPTSKRVGGPAGRLIR